MTMAQSKGRGDASGLRILLVTPAPRGTRYGNRVTALRWARLLRPLGHRVTISTEYTGQPCDVLVALHARRSAEAMAKFKDRFPDRALVLCLTGTDVYQDIKDDRDAQCSMELADRIVVLQPLAVNELPERLRHKAVPIIQSAKATPGEPRHRKDAFEVCVVGHMRPVKDPFRAALAARLLPPESRMRVLQVGGAMTEEMERQAVEEARDNPRYQWLGELPAWKTRRVMKRSQLLIVSSVLEGGANVVCEALADGVPVLGSNIPGNVGLLGEDYPGYFATGDERDLARLLRRAETDTAFLEDLRRRCAARASLVRPETEQASLHRLLQQVTA
ncbi:MAG: selenoneine biosynthesis selenosugar synthase SenB [Dehalococcoidia bacterium]